MALKYKVGDRVKIKSLDWYNKYKNRQGDINYGCETEILFTSEMSSFCGQVVTITRVYYIGGVRFYYLAEDKGVHLWVAGMFEGLVEELLDNDMKEHQKICDEVLTIQGIEPIETEMEQIIHCPEGYIFKDENGNVINATKIVLEKKKKEYPKTYKECCEILDVPTVLGFTDMADGEADLYGAFISLKRCRDAYWKIAGEEMGLGKPWEPDWENIDHDSYPTITRCGGKIIKTTIYTHDCPFAFPTPEMRDAFKQNFDPDIEICKELL